MPTQCEACTRVIVQTLARKLNYQILNLRARQPSCTVQEFNIRRGILFVSTTPKIDIVTSDTFCEYFSFPELQLWRDSNQLYVCSTKLNAVTMGEITLLWKQGRCKVGMYHIATVTLLRNNLLLWKSPLFHWSYC